MKIKLEKFGWNHIRLFDSIKLSKNQKVDFSINFDDIELNLKKRKIKEKTKENFIKITKKSENKTKYFSLTRCRTKPKLIKFQILDYEIEFSIDRPYIIEKLEDRIQITKNVDEALQKILNYTKNYLIIDKIDTTIKQNRAEIVIWTKDNSEKIIEFINNLSQSEQLKGLEEIRMNSRFDGVKFIEFDFEKNSSLDKKYYEILKLFDGETINSIRINNYNCEFDVENDNYEFNFNKIESEFLFKNLKLIKRILNFRKTNIFKFFQELSSLDFINNSSDFKKILIIFNKLEKKLINLDNLVQLFYL